MAEISIGNRRVQVPDDLDPKKPSTAAPQLRGNAFGDAAARTVAPGTVTPSLTGNPIAANPGMTGNPDNARFMKEAQMRVDPVQTAARNAAWPQTPASPASPGVLPGQSAAELAHGERVNPAQPRSNYQSPGYQQHFGPEAPPGAPADRLRAGAQGAWDDLRGRPNVGPQKPLTGFSRAKDLAGQAANIAGKVGGAIIVGDSALRNGDAMGKLWANDTASTIDKIAGTAEGVGNVAAETALSFTKKFPVLGPMIAGAVGPNPVSRIAALTPSGSTLQRYAEADPATNAERVLQTPAPASGAKPGTASAPAREVLTDVQRGGAAGPSLPTQILRQGNSYSGPANISGDVQINGKGGGTVTTMGGNPGDLTSAQRMAMDQRAHDIEMQSAGLRQQIMDRASGAPAPGAFILGGETQGSALRKQFDSTPSASILGRQGLSDRQRAADDRAKARDALDERRMLLGDETQRRGQDIAGQGQMLQHGAQLRGQDLVHGAALRGQDLDYAGKMAPVEAAKARREMVQRVMGSKEVGGDPIKGAQVLASMGFADEAKDFMGQARDKQTMEHNGTNNAKDAFKNQFFRTDDKGNRVRDEESEGEAYRRVMDKYGGEFTKLPQPEQEAAMSQARAETLILRSANKKRGTRVTDFMGTTPPAFSNLPTADQVKGLQLGRLGFWDDMFTTGPRDQGDHTLTWKDKNGDEQTMYVDPETMEQADVTRYLRGGAQIRK